MNYYPDGSPKHSICYKSLRDLDLIFHCQVHVLKMRKLLGSLGFGSQEGETAVWEGKHLRLKFHSDGDPKALLAMMEEARL